MADATITRRRFLIWASIAPAALAACASGSSEAEPRVGAYVGVVFPRRAPFRVRSELAADVVASRVGSSRTLDPSLPALPWWSVVLSVGAEWQVP